jgi:mediator of replication checkpoint protein 1
VNGYSPCHRFQRSKIPAFEEKASLCDGVGKMVVAAIASATLPTFLGWRVFSRRVERDFPKLKVQSSDTAPRHNSEHRFHLAVLTLSLYCVILGNRVILFPYISKYPPLWTLVRTTARTHRTRRVLLPTYDLGITVQHSFQHSTQNEALEQHTLISTMDSDMTMAVEQPTHTVNASAKPRVGLLAALRKPSATSSDSSAESEDDLSESDRDTPVRTSRVKSKSPRHQPTMAASQSQGEDDDENDNDDSAAAYERMKKRLAASRIAAEAPKPEGTTYNAAHTTTIASNEDEDEMPVVTRRHVMKKAKSKTPPASPTPSVRSRQSSPGLFVTPNATPAKSRVRASVGSESDESSGHMQNADLQARVRRIRAERLAKKKEEEEAQQALAKAPRRRVDQDLGSGSDGEDGRRLTQQAKPTRKAGKKAMELMARDQQRISRNMQLTHQAKTKKKYGLDSLFTRFAYNAPNSGTTVAEGLPTPEASSALGSSDIEVNQTHNTPPASPPKQKESPLKSSMEIETAACAAPVSETSIMPTLDKGKGRAPEFQHLPPHLWTKQSEQVAIRSALVDVQKPIDQPMVDLSDSDDDLEIVQPKSRFPVFDRIPLRKQQESSSLLHLRHLAHVTTASNNTRKGVKSVSLGEMHLSLAQKAREQAHVEREEKIADLKRRGIHVETEEEREINQMEIEDMVAQFEKQRQEDLKLAKAERKEAKQNGETIDDLPSSDESDGDYVGSGEENTNEVDAEAGNDEVDLELSGSEDEEMELQATDADSEEEDVVEDKTDSESATQEQQVEEDADMEDEVVRAPVRKRTATRPRNVVVDEEDESDNEADVPASPTQQATQDDAMAAFGFGNANVGLGLTQMFAGTMANLESGSQPTGAEPEQNSLDFLRSLPDTQPGANFTQTSDYLVPNSQSLMSPQKESQAGIESQFSIGISEIIKPSLPFPNTQLDDLPEPTQDAGFSFSRSPAGLMHPPSTVDTVMMSIAESPIKQRKGKLQRGRQHSAAETSDVEKDLLDSEADLTEEDDIQLPPKPRDAFAKLQKAAKKQKALGEYNKKTSLAKDAVMDQAEESEDEYAGLGGASDDDSGLEDEDTKNMIEHGEVEVDERQIAAFFA